VAVGLYSACILTSFCYSFGRNEVFMQRRIFVKKHWWNRWEDRGPVPAWYDGVDRLIDARDPKTGKLLSLLDLLFDKGKKWKIRSVRS